MVMPKLSKIGRVAPGAQLTSEVAEQVSVSGL
jgi:hypothetical protein